MKHECKQQEFTDCPQPSPCCPAATLHLIKTQLRYDVITSALLRLRRLCIPESQFVCRCADWVTDKTDAIVIQVNRRQIDLKMPGPSFILITRGFKWLHGCYVVIYILISLEGLLTSPSMTPWPHMRRTDMLKIVAQGVKTMNPNTVNYNKDIEWI